jgi:hypothetical protein
MTSTREFAGVFARRHYIDIAALLQAQYNGDEDNDRAIDRTVDAFVKLFTVDSSTFKAERFIAAATPRRP